MDSPYRERFRTTMARHQPDRPPMDLAATDMTEMEGGPRRLLPLLGIEAKGDAKERDELALRALDIDIRGVGGILSPKNSPLAKKLSDTQYSDCWGITYQFNGHHYEAVGRPLADAGIDDLEKYPWPDPDGIDPDEIARIAERAAYLYEKSPYVVCGRHPYYGVFELGCWMCGFDDFLYRLAGEPEFVIRFFDKVHSYQKRVDALYYGAIGRHLHFTTSGDDFATQTSLFLSPEMFREMILPYYASRIKNFRTYSDAYFFHHSCGALRPLIGDLADVGVDIINPMQPRAAGMEPEGLKKDFGARVAFYGGVDTQHLLPEGTPEDVEEETRRLVRIMGAGGGYILSAAHVMQEDVPVENMVAMYRAGRGVSTGR